MEGVGFTGSGSFGGRVPDVPGAGRTGRPTGGRGKPWATVSIVAAAPTGATGYRVASAVRSDAVVEATAASARGSAVS